MTTPISTLSSYDYISSFSPEIILEIAQHSNATDLFTATLVSKGWKQVFETCYIWEEFLNDMPLFCKRDQLVESAFQAFVREKKMRLSVIKKAPFVANLGNNYYRALDACKDGFVVQNKHSGVLFIEHSLNIKKYQLSKKEIHLISHYDNQWYVAIECSLFKLTDFKLSKVYEANTDIDDFLACAYGFFIRRQQTISLHSANFLEFKFKEIECFKYSRMTFFNHQLVVATSSFTLEFLDQDFNCLKKIPVKNKILFLTVLNNELISADNCNYICFWSAKGVMRKQYGAHSNWTLTCLTTMGDYLLTSSFDKTICFWEPDGTSYSINLENPILQLATNQTQIIMNLQDTSLILWDLMGTKPNPNYSSADPLTLTDRLRDALKRKFSIISSSLTQRLNFGFFKT